MKSLMHVRSTHFLVLALVALGLLVGGCQSSGGGVSGGGTLLGGVLGAGIGYGLGGGKGALIGGLVGAALGTIIEAAINASSQRAAQTGRPAVAYDNKRETRVESYPIRHTADGQKMQVASVVYERKATPSGGTTYVRAQRDGKPVPVVVTEVPATPGANGLAEGPRTDKPKVVYGDDVSATARATTDSSGRTVYAIEKSSPTGRETVMLTDADLNGASSASAGSSGRSRD
ncbi:MAG: hypothetical protein HZA54_03225 [Planctomycetes bacterium]|nr:hypothetical protein [Planctomycetota bacterium]